PRTRPCFPSPALFRSEGQAYQLPRNLGGHAIHGVGFVMPWQVVAQSQHGLELALELPHDGRWPFGGHARQRIVLEPRALLLELRSEEHTSELQSRENL